MKTFTKNGVPGYYLFEELIEGDYIVQIDAGNFTTGKPLAGLISSNGAPDPDPAKDHDDNGKLMEGYGVVASAVTISNPADPTDEAAKRNLTVDFGFYERNTTCSDPTFYALQDSKLNDTQFFTVDPRTMTVADLGPLYEGHDIEGLDMHPETLKLYATSGDDTGCIDPNADLSSCDKHPPGHLYMVNPDTGELTSVSTLNVIGSSEPIGEVSGISFNPKTGELWAWADSKGLYKINITNGDTTLVIPETMAIEALTWDNEGEVLYASADSVLWAASDWNDDGRPQSVQEICSGLPGQVEALDMADNNVLLFALHNGNDLNIYGGRIDGFACPELERIKIDTLKYYDIEAITWRIGCDVEKYTTSP
jgi:hypothetical protein